MKDDHDQGDDQNDVDQAAQDLLENHKAEKPDDYQNYSYGEKHGSTLRQENSNKRVAS